MIQDYINVTTSAGIEKQINKLAHFFGGYSSASRLLPASELIKIALFDGPVGTISPFARLGHLSDPVEPLHQLSLRSVGYERGARYSILNSKKQLIYRDYPVQKDNDWLFGLGEKDRKLIERGRHGEYFYLYFRNSRGPQLGIIWLCKELPQWVVERRLVEWEQQYSEARKGLEFDELSLDLSSLLTRPPTIQETDVIYIGMLPGLITSEYTQQQIRQRVTSEELEEGLLASISPAESGYIRIKGGHWLTFWLAGDDGVYKRELKIFNLEGIGYERVYQSKSGAYYIRGLNAGGSWLFSNGLGSRPVVGNPFESRRMSLRAKLMFD